MRRVIAFMLLAALAASMDSAQAAGPPADHALLQRGAVSDDLPAPANSHERQDTLWFGGDNGSGLAVLGERWNFQTPGSNGFQGCISWDETADPGVYFGRVTASSFTSHGDPCTPMIEGTPGMLWCGFHEDEAIARDFVAGMGYRNYQCQKALSPEYSINPATQAVDLAFQYFNHSEPAYDYTYVNILCYDVIHDLIETYEVAAIDNIVGDASAPAFFDEGVEAPAGSLPSGTTRIQIEFRFVADQGWSDEDGLWDSPCGPFAADDVTIAVGGTTHDYTFDASAEGWQFEACPGIGAYMHIVHDYEYQEWLDDLGLTCDCTLIGDAIGFVSTMCASGPGLVPGIKEQFETGVVARGPYQPPYFNAAISRYDAFLNLPQATGAHYRPGYRMYPYTSEVNPAAHWSPRQGQNLWYYVGSPFCALNGENLSTMADAPLPAEWDSLKYVIEVFSSCDAFQVPSTVCIEPGCTGGSPVFDNFRVGLTNAADAPAISWIDGGLFHDGFGQNYPTYLEPSDRCNSNISYDLSREDTSKNDWHGDSTVVSGPVVGTSSSRWLCDFCVKVARLGARQTMIPEYYTWKARLPGDPEEGFVCVLMDSLETNNHTQVWSNRFASYFHEDAPGFQGPTDFNAVNEILPDQVFVPGTRIEYYARSYWFNGGAPPQSYFPLGLNPQREMEFLPTMELRPGEEYTVQWPSVLYVDAYNFGGEQFMIPALEQLGIPYDKFDYLDTSTNYNCSFRRDLGGSTYNPGGYGNNGCTPEQLLGYRLVILSIGNLPPGGTEREDYTMYDQWLASTACGLAGIRRGFIFDGDEMGGMLADEVHGMAINFAHNVLGVTLVADAYRDHNEDPAFCVYLEPVDNPQFSPAEPGIGLFGNGCPQEYNYNVLDVQPGVSNVTGNLDFWSYEQTGNQEYVEFAQIVRRNEQAGIANWRTVVNGFSFHHLSQRGCQGEPCGQDSVCRVGGTSSLFGPMLEWMGSGGTPFTKWIYPCFSTGVDPDETHVTGPVNYLYASRPNPFNARAAIRFSLASAGEVELDVYDVSGRLVKTLMHATAPAGESSVVWDGTDNQGNRVGAGMYWMQLATRDGFRSGKRLVVLR